MFIMTYQVRVTRDTSNCLQCEFSIYDVDNLSPVFRRFSPRIQQCIQQGYSINTQFPPKPYIVNYVTRRQVQTPVELQTEVREDFTITGKALVALVRGPNMVSRHEIGMSTQVIKG